MSAKPASHPQMPRNYVLCDCTVHSSFINPNQRRPPLHLHRLRRRRKCDKRSSVSRGGVRAALPPAGSKTGRFQLLPWIMRRWASRCSEIPTLHRGSRIPFHPPPPGWKGRYSVFICFKQNRGGPASASQTQEDEGDLRTNSNELLQIDWNLHQLLYNSTCSDITLTVREYISQSLHFTQLCISLGCFFLLSSKH